MTDRQRQQWIRAELLELASTRYPNNPKLQMLYQIGFLQAQLAQAMCSDTAVTERFIRAVTVATE